MNPVFIHFNEDTHKYIVTTAKFWYWTQTDTRWMDDPKIGKFGSIPEVDVMDEEFEFDDEQEALKKVAELYASQLSFSPLGEDS